MVQWDVFFLEHYKRYLCSGEHNRNKSALVEGREDEIWDNAKDLVCEGITEKRNSRQTELKKSWNGKCKIFVTIVSHFLTSSYDFYFFYNSAVKKICETNEDYNRLFTKVNMVNIMTSSTQEDANNSDQRKSFFLFLEKFGASTAEAANFNASEKKKRCFREVCTISDEAFAIFTIDRCWNYWSKKWNNDANVSIRSSDYARNTNKKYGGISTQGLIRFNEIAGLVAKARRSAFRQNLEEEFRKFHEGKGKNMDTNGVAETRNTVVEESFVPYCDEFPVEIENAGNGEDQENDISSTESYVDNDVRGRKIVFNNTKDLINTDNQEGSDINDEISCDGNKDGENAGHNAGDNDDETTSTCRDESANNLAEDDDDFDPNDLQEDDDNFELSKQTIIYGDDGDELSPEHFDKMMLEIEAEKYSDI